MEWNQDQIQFLLDNKDVIEKEDWSEFWARSYQSSLSLNERKHLLLGISVLKGLPITLRVKPILDEGVSSKLDVELDVDLKVVIARMDFDETWSDSEIMKEYSESLKYKGLSQYLIEEVWSKVKVER